MIELFKSFFETSNERIKNPLIGTFTISWILLNWRPISIVFFSEKTILERIELIDEKYTSILTYLIVPITIAFFYVIVLPYLMWGIDELIKKSSIGRKNNLTNQIILDFRGKQLIAAEESKLEDLKANYRERADSNKQIEQLRKQLDEREAELNSSFQALKELKNQNQELNSLIEAGSIPVINNTESYENQYNDFHDSDLSKVFLEVGISIRNKGEFPDGLNDILKEKFLIQDIVTKTTGPHNFSYELTDKGFFFWKKQINKTRVFR